MVSRAERTWSGGRIIRKRINESRRLTIASITQGALVAPDGNPVMALSYYSVAPADGRQLLEGTATLGDGNPLTFASYYPAGTIVTPDGRPVYAINLPDPSGGAAVLAELSLSDPTWVIGSAQSGDILGTTAGSTIALSNAPTGFSINSAARTWSYDGTGIEATGLLTLTETLGGAANTPRASVIGWARVAAPVEEPEPGAGTARSASTITRTSANTIPPSPTFTFDRTMWVEGDKVIARWSANEDMSSPTEGPVVTLAAATTSYDLINPDLTSGPVYLEIAAWSGTRPGSLNWSNRIGAGDSTAPTITSGNTRSGYQGVAGVFPVTASKGGTLTIVGGANSDLFTVSGMNLLKEAQPDVTSLTVDIQVVSYAGVPSATQTVTVNDAANTPAAFSFGADITGATQSTVYTRQMVDPISGLAPGTSVAASAGGALWSKDGTTFSTAAGTVTNGDQPYVRLTSGGAEGVETPVTFTAAVTSDTWAVTTAVSPVAFSYTEEASPENRSGLATTTTFSAQSLGAASPGRRIVIHCYLWDGNDNPPTSITVGGVAATMIGNAAGANGGRQSVWMAHVPTSTTGDVEIVSPNSIASIGIRLFRLVGSNNTPTVVYTSGSFAGASQSLAVDTPADGATSLLGYFSQNTGTAGWTNATGQSLKQVAVTTVSGLRTTAGTATVSVGSFGGHSSLLAVSFAPA